MPVERLFRIGLMTLWATITACSGDSGPAAPVQDVDTVDVDPCVLDDMFVPGGASRADIVALLDPTLVGPLDASVGFLTRNSRVIGFEVNGQYVAVPHNILWRHEIVNLDVAGLPLAVTYSPLSGSSMVFDRRSIGGAAIGVSDQVLYNNLVMVNLGTEGQTDAP